VRDVLVHPGYDRLKPVSQNDIALLHLKSPTAAPPMRLATPDGHYRSPRDVPNLAGWGLTVDGDEGSAPARLNEVYAELQPNATCSVGAGYRPFSPATMLCAGTPHQTSCSGDSGGPLAVFDADTNEPVLYGIVAWGDETCDSRTYFSRVSAFGDFLAQSAAPEPPPEPAPATTAAPAPTPIPTPPPPADVSAPRITKLSVGVSAKRIVVRLHTDEPASARFTLRRRSRTTRLAAGANRIVLGWRRASGRLELKATNAAGISTVIRRTVRRPRAHATAARWRTLAPATLARTEVAAQRIGGAIYVAGGYLPDQSSTPLLERYDIAADRWSRRAPMPVGLNHAAAAVYHGDLYVVGGYAGNTATDGLLRYDPERNRWDRLAPMPTARAALTAGVIGDRLYAAGGAVNGRALTTLEVYDFKTRRWSSGPPLSTAREHLGGAVSGDAFYVLAGRPPNLTVGERFVPSRNRWERVPDMRKARGGTAAAALDDGRIVIAGGEETAGTIREVELYDPRTRRWSRLPEMPRPRHGLGVVAAGRRVFTVEGGDKPGFYFSRAIEVLTVPARR
jgi:N-acetylneuraminic acid mutarotase